ncbi:D-alanine--D-alanine ligase [Flavobacteriaceae bacterium TK19130]|nr:D-alanine--D-alanine ligase [Thermobacterium salinum]
MKKLNVFVAMGGYSSEYEISMNSGTVVCGALDSEKYRVFPIHILEKGWEYAPSEGEKIPVDKADFSVTVEGEKHKPDVIFNCIHGTPGEDGYLQAYWELLGIPQTSCEYYPAALSFNKRDTLSVLKQFGVECANSYYVNKGTEYDVEEIVKKVGLPCFVKPNRSGSSFGISKVKEMNEMDAAIERAFEEDTEVLIETGLNGMEVQVGVYRHDGEVIALPPTEIVSKNEFFDYEAKYLGASEEITPARISEKETQMLQTQAIKIYRLLNMKGITRSDFILVKGKPYFIELNSNPGLSTESIVPQQVREAGLTLKEFFSILIDEALK